MGDMTKKNLRETAVEIFRRTLQEASFERQAAAQIRYEGGMLHLGTAKYDLEGMRRILVVAVGKAAGPMSAHVSQVLAPHLGPDRTLQGIVIGPQGTQPPPGFTGLPGAHPLPDATSRAAAVAVLDFLRPADSQTFVLFLISGGASAMLELPLDETISLEDTAGFHRALIHSGLPIWKMNVLRKHFSAVKGGRLATAAKNAMAQCTLLISDVPADKLDTVGSGPSMADPSTIADCRAILDEAKLWEKIPLPVAAFFRSPDLPETPKHIENSSVVTLLSSQTMSDAAACIAKKMGFETIVDNTCDEWPVEKAAAYLVEAAEAYPAQNLCFISVGEVLVEVSGKGGMGGRNLHFALDAARLLKGTSAVLSAGSDGIDGNTQVAGAAVDNETWQRAVDAGLKPAEALWKFDSFTVLNSLGETIETGATGNNVRDLRLVLRSNGE
jgi:hydroxypyruvate reductase